MRGVYGGCVMKWFMPHSSSRENKTNPQKSWGSFSFRTDGSSRRRKTPGGDPLRWEESARVSRGGNVGKRNRLNLPAYLFIIYIYFFFFFFFCLSEASLTLVFPPSSGESSFSVVGSPRRCVPGSFHLTFLPGYVSGTLPSVCIRSYSLTIAIRNGRECR